MQKSPTITKIERNIATAIKEGRITMAVLLLDRLDGDFGSTPYSRIAAACAIAINREDAHMGLDYFRKVFEMPSDPSRPLREFMRLARAIQEIDGAAIAQQVIRLRNAVPLLDRTIMMQTLTGVANWGDLTPENAEIIMQRLDEIIPPVK